LTIEIEFRATVTDWGVECPLVCALSGELFSLTGETGDLVPGDHIKVIGTPLRVSVCQPGAGRKGQTAGVDRSAPG